MAGSKVVENLTHNPEIGGSNPAVREKMAKKNFRPTETNKTASEHYGL